VEVVASLSQGRTAAAQCGLFTHKSVPVIFEPSCTYESSFMGYETDTKSDEISITSFSITCCTEQD